MECARRYSTIRTIRVGAAAILSFLVITQLLDFDANEASLSPPESSVLVIADSPTAGSSTARSNDSAMAAASPTTVRSITTNAAGLPAFPGPAVARAAHVVNPNSSAAGALLVPWHETGAYAERDARLVNERPDGVFSPRPEDNIVFGFAIVMRGRSAHARKHADYWPPIRTFVGSLRCPVAPGAVPYRGRIVLATSRVLVHGPGAEARRAFLEANGVEVGRVGRSPRDQPASDSRHQ